MQISAENDMRVQYLFSNHSTELCIIRLILNHSYQKLMHKLDVLIQLLYMTRNVMPSNNDANVQSFLLVQQNNYLRQVKSLSYVVTENSKLDVPMQHRLILSIKKGQELTAISQKPKNNYNNYSKKSLPLFPLHSQSQVSNLFVIVSAFLPRVIVVHFITTSILTFQSRKFLL